MFMAVIMIISYKYIGSLERTIVHPNPIQNKAYKPSKFFPYIPFRYKKDAVIVAQSIITA